ncbi:hypothetical protein GOP47_0015595 [Adiantum capillus-veneris]|uniref:Uncharacterized protein n=1 Tax=Adiantum capillus-veneris TaxID=13818 RepID=A0A9D4ZBT2_ADICA|nr:hypothetical protein GOP47_0015595 [Adiantum capillus-veneris]
MAKGPGLFSDLGKKARDLLNKDYNYDHKLTFTTNTSAGVTFTTGGTLKGEAMLGELTAKFQKENWTADVKFNSNSNVFTTITWDEPTPGLKAILNLSYPDQKSGKAELQYKHEYAGVSSNVGLTPSPLTEFSAVVGNNEIAVGGEVGFDTAAGNVTKYNAGLSYTKPDFTAAFFLADKADTLKFSYLHTLSPLTNTTVGAEIAHSISKDENTFTVGGLYTLDPLTVVKGRLSQNGKIAALIQHEWKPKSLVTLSGEVDSRALDKNAKVGLALSLKP